jgi:hypothetical protein
MDRNGRNVNRDLVRDIAAIQNRIQELEAEIEARAEVEAARPPALPPAQVPPQEVAPRPTQIRTHLPDKFEGRKDDWQQFMADVRSYCVLTAVPVHLQVDYAFRCLGKMPKKVWLSKRQVWEATHAGEPVTLDTFDQLMTTVYDSQDRATRARNRLDTVYQGTEPLDKYIERITTLFSEVEVHEPLSMGEKLHRFKKGLREDLQEKCVLNPHTGNPYDDLDTLIAALTKYEAALGHGQRQPKQRRVGHQLAATGHSTGQRTLDNGPPLVVPQPSVPVPQLGAAQQGPVRDSHDNPRFPRRDGLPPGDRHDFRSAPGERRQCFHCKVWGHEQWQCPVKKWEQGEELTSTDMANVQTVAQIYRAKGRVFPEYGSRRPMLPMPPSLPMPPGYGGAAQGRGQGQGRGGDRGFRGGSGYRSGRRGGGRGN